MNPPAEHPAPPAQEQAGPLLPLPARGGMGFSGPLFRLDPGWLFLVAGVALLAAVAIIPALEDLRVAEAKRDSAYAVEQYRRERLQNYGAYLDALRREEPVLVRSLAASQLNLAPAGRLVMVEAGARGLPAAEVFEALEPAPPAAVRPRTADTRLRRLATDERMRLWLIGAGALCVLVGLLPRARG